MDSPKAECETLMNAMLPFAKQLLAKYHEFYPFGGAMSESGKIISVATYDGQEHPPYSDVIAFSKKAFVAGARNGQYKATALLYDVRITMRATGEKTDAVAASLNHREGYSVIVKFPYKFLESGALAFSDAIAQEGEADIFPPK